MNFILKISIPLSIISYTAYYLYTYTNKNKRSSNSLELFDLSKLSVGDNILIIGRRCTGKTTLISKILNFNKNINPALIVSPADSFERHYEKNFMDYENIIHHQYNSYLITNFIQSRVNNIISDISDLSVSYTVLDNCLLNTVNDDHSLNDLLINGYFYKTINILSINNPYSNAADFRTKMDYVFILKDTHLLSSKKIYEDYFKYIITFEEYNNFISKYTQDYRCLVIDYNNGGKLYYF